MAFTRQDDNYKWSCLTDWCGRAASSTLPGAWVCRWAEKASVPSAYHVALMKMAGRAVDYGKLGYKQKDQFYTPAATALRCFEAFLRVLEARGEEEASFVYVEPSAGAGAFLGVLPSGRTTAMDVEPRHPDVCRQDYLDWRPDEKKGQRVVVFGNPPFGLRGQLALQFINHSALFAEYVCFILPPLFDSDGKGAPRARVRGLNLIYSEPVEDGVFTDPEGRRVRVRCVFQVWSKHHSDPGYDTPATPTDGARVFSLSDGGTPSSTRNKDMLLACDVYLPSTCFGRHNTVCHDGFERLPGRRGYGVVFRDKSLLPAFRAVDWGDIAFLSTNSAYNLRRSQILAVVEKIERKQPMHQDQRWI